MGLPRESAREDHARSADSLPDRSPGRLALRQAVSAPQGTPVTVLLDRIRAGSRAAAAELIHTYEPMIRRRIRGQLSGRMRRLFDSEDIFSTVCRRLDHFVERRSVSATSMGELIKLLQTITERSIVDKARIVTKQRILERNITERQGPEWRFDRTSPRDSARDWVEYSRLLETELDRQILFHWLRGLTHNVIAEQLGISHDLARKRWQLIRSRLRACIEPGGTP